jgi:hypothetical protein
MEPKLETYLDLFDGFSEEETKKSPLGFQKIYKKKILTEEDDQHLLVQNDRYHFKGGNFSSHKPISKII